MRVASWLVIVCGGCGFSPAQSKVAHHDAADAPDAPPDALPTDLIAYYPMESLPMHDVTGHGHDGTCTACPTVGAGIRGNALSFTNARVDIPGALDLRTQNGTVAAWLAFDTLAANYACPFGPIVRPAMNLDTWQLCIHDSTRWAVFLQTMTPGITEFDTVTSLVAGAWHHVAIKWTLDTEAFYVDGAMLETNPIQPLVYDMSPITVGADRLTNGAIDVPFDGRIDELEIFDRALMPGEVAALAIR